MAYGWYNGNDNTLGSIYQSRADWASFAGFGIEQAVNMSEPVLENLVRVAQAALDRKRKTTKDAADIQRKLNQNDGWRAFATLLLGAIQALSAHRALQRHYALESRTFPIGSKEPKGSYWTQMDISRASRNWRGSRARKESAKAGYPHQDVAPWERTADEHKAYMLKKLADSADQKKRPRP